MTVISFTAVVRFAVECINTTMRLLRSRHSRGSDIAPSKEMRRSRVDANYFGGNWHSLLVLAVLPVIVMMLVSLWNMMSNTKFFGSRRRMPYVFNWGDAIEIRSQLSAKYNQAPFLPNSVPKKADLSVSEFRDLWDAKWPLIITDVVPSWGAYHWSKDFLFKFYSKSNLTVTQTKGNLSQASGSVMSLADFYKLTFERATPNSWAYATDEHFISHHPPLHLDIGANKYADEDFFKLLPKEVRPKNSMLLWGTKYSRSYVHVDPYNWTGTIAVLQGLKRWKLWPPNPDNILGFTPRRSGFPLDCPTRVSELDFFSKSPPKLTMPKDLGGGPQYNLEFDQKPGELLIIPTGWGHQAYNVEETIAISSQYMNRNNFRAVLEEIIQCTQIDSLLPDYYSMLSAEEQVKVVSSLLPEEMLESARKTNSEVRKMLLSGEDES